jgi:vacuolar-type H+-ATPase subunit F/Vma7
MSLPVYIGDEISAAGFRLAGMRVRVPGESEYLQALDWAMEQDTQLVMISSVIASRIAVDKLASYLSRITPAMVVVPDTHGDVPMPDIKSLMRKQLGVHE